MNINIPTIEAFCRLEFMNQHGAEYVGEFVPVQIFGVASIPGQTPLFHFFADDGGIWWRMPIHAFCHKRDARRVSLDEVCLWDSFSYNCHVCVFDILKHKRLSYVDRNRKEHVGVYLFTLDWFGDDLRSYGFSETPGQHKCGHVLQLDNGNFAIQPNNRVRLFDPNFVTKDERYSRKLASHLYTSEQSAKWRTSDDENYDYGIDSLRNLAQN